MSWNDNKNVFFLPSEIIRLLDGDKIEELQNTNKLIQVKFHIYAETDEEEYRCRSIDSQEMTISIDLSELGYSLKEKIRDYIECNFSTSCSTGKYPDIELYGALVETNTDYDSDRGRGYASLDGYVWVFMSG
jgi:hypothetical protein